MEEQRRAPRIQVTGLAVHLSASGRRVLTIAENISSGGLFARTDQELQVGTEVRIDAVRPGWRKALTLAGRVVNRTDPQAAVRRHASPGVGIQFGALDADQRARLQEALAELAVVAEQRELAARSLGESAAPRTPPVHGKVPSSGPVTLPPPGPVPLPARAPLPGPGAGRESLAPEAGAGELARLQRRCDDLVRQVEQRDAEIGRLRTELQAARARLRTLGEGPDEPRRSRS